MLLYYIIDGELVIIYNGMQMRILQLLFLKLKILQPFDGETLNYFYYYYSYANLALNILCVCMF